jgi:hypothetical protein
MNLPEIFRTFSRATWWALAAAGLVVVLLIWAGLTYGARLKDQVVRQGADATLGEARTGSAREAIGTVTNNAAGEVAIDARTRGSEDAIRNAAPVDRDDATLRELCHSPSASRRPDCRVFNARP